MKTYTEDQLFSIIEQNDWSACICNNEPEFGMDTIQVALENEGEYFGQFVGDRAENVYSFEFYT